VNELALFAGAGGGILGGHLLGWRTVCAVEWEQYPASVLCARQNDKILPPFPIWDDVQTFDGKPWAGIVDVVSGGFPCQDISVAGKGDGLDGKRSSMWKHMARIIGEIRPRYAFVENSPMLVNRGLERVLADLTSMGYDSRWGVISAANVGANHKRERIWILANTKLHGFSATQVARSVKKTTREQQARPINTFNIEGTSGVPTAKSNVTYACDQRLQRGKRVQHNEKQNIGGQAFAFGTTSKCSNDGTTGSNWWDIEPNVGRVADGVAARVDRLKAIGNGQVPLCAATAWELLK
jgi:DNA (cytosine-5)-methyltransferase 1